MSKQNGNRDQPPKLGDVEFRPSKGKWALYRRDKLVCNGMSLEQMLAVIRGELLVESLAPAGQERR